MKNNMNTFYIENISIQVDEEEKQIWLTCLYEDKFTNKFKNILNKMVELVKTKVPTDNKLTYSSIFVRSFKIIGIDGYIFDERNDLTFKF